ncbi:MAG: hypothetical protein H6603_03225 [Flavobacteriales bacterium]|nr:hypothetical protein [Flavobacteriales bacterium]MCB9191406.1 hypothetical protein [Flavobacteriales bacterium]MCB9203968.1 hypothetical protein [Flavobacteriales bacterium]
MFKRLFLFSGVVAFILSVLVMWFWYIPNHQNAVNPDNKLNQEVLDTVALQEPSELLE